MSIRKDALATSALAALGFAIALPAAAGQAKDTERVLYSFSGGADGSQPYAGVVRDSAGNLYGAAAFGGTGQNCGPAGCGTIFKLSTSGAFTVLYTFSGGNDGGNPFGDLLRDGRTGDLYGTTTYGGTGGYGTIFKLAADGTYTVLHAFSGSDGAVPESRLIRRNGDLYGTTYSGGDLDCGAPYGCGTVFRLASDGGYTLLHAFTGGSDGLNPTGARLKMDSAGNLYGTTQFGGGSSACDEGCGVVFKVTPDGTETVLHAFAGGSDGQFPAAGLDKDKLGNLFGVTQGGGGSGNCFYGCGTVFRLAPDGTETVLHAFMGGKDGANPLGTPLRTGSGAIYGTTNDGQQGTVFKLKPDGAQIVLHTFGGAGDGLLPYSAVTDDNGRNLYGTTNLGGDYGLGTIYTLKK